MEPALRRTTSPWLPRDWFFWTGVGVWLVSFLPSVAPVLSPDLTYAWADEYSDAPGLLMALVATVLAVRRADTQRERVFWRLLIGCIGGWLAVRTLYLLSPYEQWGTATDLTSDLFYLLGYLSVSLAVERRPDHPPTQGARGQLQRVELAGTLVFAFGLLTYFVLIPSVFNPDVYASWVSSLLLYSVLDAYLVVRGVALLRQNLESTWTLPIRWLTVAFAFWLIGDLTEGLMYLDAVPYTDPGTPWDILWHIPSLALLISVRSRLWAQRPATDEGQHLEVMESQTRTPEKLT